MGRKKQKPKTIKEIMDDIIDYDELHERKSRSKNAGNDDISNSEGIQTPSANKWYDEVMDESMFEIKKIGEEYYLRHVQWKKYIYVGPYDTRKEAKKTMLAYIENSKIVVLKRNPIENLHSVLIG